MESSGVPPCCPTPASAFFLCVCCYFTKWNYLGYASFQPLPSTTTAEDPGENKRLKPRMESALYKMAMMFQFRPKEV